MNIVRNTVKIVIVVLGLIVGSIATIKTDIIPTEINYSTNEDVKVLVNKQGETKKSSSITLDGKSMLPIHYDGTSFYYSPTLRLTDLQTSNVSDNQVYGSYEFRINKNYDNVALQVDLALSGEDEINKSLRVLITAGEEKCLLSLEDYSQVLNVTLNSTTPTYVRVWMWYELDSEYTTIDNINNATGSEVTLNFYAYVMEE